MQEELPDAHYIVRTAWLYGHEGSNFVKTMLRLEVEHDTVDVVDDQLGQPTYAADLAAQIAALVDARPAAGIFHGTNSGTVSWNGFTREIFHLIGADPERVRDNERGKDRGARGVEGVGLARRRKEAHIGGQGIRALSLSRTCAPESLAK